MKVKLSKIKKMIKELDKFYASQPQPVNLDTVEVGFEFIIGSLFPDAYENMKELLMQEYLKGYAEGEKSNGNSNKSE